MKSTSVLLTQLLEYFKPEPISHSRDLYIYNKDPRELQLSVRERYVKSGRLYPHIGKFVLQLFGKV